MYSSEKLHPTKMTTARLKAESRQRDADRLARGEMTAEELQRENSIFTAEQIRSMKICRDPVEFAALCQKRLIPMTWRQTDQEPR